MCLKHNTNKKKTMFLYKSEFAERYGIPREELRIAMNVRWL